MAHRVIKAMLGTLVLLVLQAPLGHRVWLATPFQASPVLLDPEGPQAFQATEVQKVRVDHLVLRTLGPKDRQGLLEHQGRLAFLGNQETLDQQVTLEYLASVGSRVTKEPREFLDMVSLATQAPQGLLESRENKVTLGEKDPLETRGSKDKKVSEEDLAFQDHHHIRIRGRGGTLDLQAQMAILDPLVIGVPLPCRGDQGFQVWRAPQGHRKADQVHLEGRGPQDLPDIPGLKEIEDPMVVLELTGTRGTQVHLECQGNLDHQVGMASKVIEDLARDSLDLVVQKDFQESLDPQAVLAGLENQVTEVQVAIRDHPASREIQASVAQEVPLVLLALDLGAPQVQPVSQAPLATKASLVHQAP